MAQIESIEIAGYKSIRAATIELGAINVLIGANGAGKSNLLGVFGLLGSLSERRLQLHVAQQGGADRILHFGRKRTSQLRLCVRFGQPAYEAVLIPTDDDALVFADETAWLGVPPSASGGGAVAGGPDAELPRGFALGTGGHRESGIGIPQRSPGGADGSWIAAFGFVTPADAVLAGGRVDAAAITPVSDSIRRRSLFHFHDTSASSAIKRKQRIDDNRALHAGGDNLAPFLFALQATAPGASRRIVEAIRAVAPFFDDFDLAPDVVNPDVIQLAWRHAHHDGRFGAAALSDGTLRFMCLATLLLQPVPPATVLIDEPELGLHPFAIHQLMALVRSAAVTTQVVIATQSVTLLDEAAADEVIVCELRDGGSEFRRLDEAALAGWRDDYSLGELWLKNVLGGRPR